MDWNAIFFQFTLEEQTPLRPLRTVGVVLNALIIIFIHSQSESLLIRWTPNIFMSICVTLFSFSNAFFPQGPLPSALKVRGGSPFSQYEMLGSETLGIQSQGTADSWHRTPGSKIGSKSATSSWPPGWHGLFCVTIWQRLNRIRRSRTVSDVSLSTVKMVSLFCLYLACKLLCFH